MYKFLTKNGQALAFGLGGLVVAIFLITALTGLSSAGYEVGTDLNKLSADQKAGMNFFNIGIGLTVFMAALAGFLALVVFGITDLMKFPKSAIKFGIGLLALLAVFFVLYSTASGEATGSLARIIDKFNVTDGVSKFISAGIWTTIGLALSAAGIMFVAEIRNMFK